MISLWMFTLINNHRIKQLLSTYGVFMVLLLDEIGQNKNNYPDFFTGKKYLTFVLRKRLHRVHQGYIIMTLYPDNSGTVMSQWNAQYT